MSMRSRRLILGIDGGGSKTLALLATADGEILGRGLAGTSNYQSVGVDGAFAGLDTSIAAAFDDAYVDPQPLAAIGLGLAGVDRPEDHALVLGWAREKHPGVPVVIANDAQIVLAAGTPDGWGVAVICGTGSIVYGSSAAGDTARAGGWGHIMGDEGSGYAIGQAALRAVMQAHDGRGPVTTLTHAVLDHWQLASPPDLVGQVYRASLAPSDIAGLAPVVAQAAEAGDTVATAIIQHAAAELARAVQAVVRRLRLASPVPCALAGGLLLNSPALRAALADSAAVAKLRLEPLTDVSQPAEGAVRLARALIV
jgi:N-acetylglucosamine kinase-like BadF-type ATPase